MLSALQHRLRRVRAGGDRGVTLVELIVAMGISTIVGGIALSFFVAVVRSSDTASATNVATADARIAMAAWVGMLQAADWVDPNAQTDRFEEITPTKIVFFADLGNRNTSAQSGVPAAGAPTKVALMLTNVDPSTGLGRLVEIVFKSDDTTPKLVHQLAPYARGTNGAWIFTPYNQIGGRLDLGARMCLQGSTPVAGYCAKAPASAGLLDPSVATAASSAVTSGPLRGDGTANATLAAVGRVDIAFTVTDAQGDHGGAFLSSATISSGFPS